MHFLLCHVNLLNLTYMQGRIRRWCGSLLSSERLPLMFSFSGKTTCLDVLAQRKNIGVVSGDVLVDGRPLDSTFARGTAYGQYDSPHRFAASY
jgi:hypothetical protein